MRRITPVLLLAVMIQLTTVVEIAVAKLFPKAPTKAFDDHGIGKIAYSPDGNLLTIRGSEGLFLYDPKTLDRVAHLGEFNDIFTMAFSPDGTLLALGDLDTNIRLWHIATRKQIHAFTGHKVAVRSIDFSPDGTFLASASGDGTVRVWNIEKRRQVAALDIKKLTDETPRRVIFSPNGSLVGISVLNGELILWDFQTEQIQHRIEHQFIFPEIAFSRDGKTVLCIKGDLKFWDVETGKLLAIQKNTRNQKLTTHPNRNIVASFNWSSPAPVRLWDVGQKTELVQLPVQGNVLSVAFNPVSDQLALTAGTTTIQIWDFATQKLLREKETHTGNILLHSISPDGETFAACHADYSIRLWDIESGDERARFIGHTTIPRVMAFSPDGAMLVFGKSRTIHIWNVAPGTEYARFDLIGPLNFVFSPDSRNLIVANDFHTVQVWDIAEKKLLATLQGEDGDARGIAAELAISPDGKYLASTEASTAIHLWNLETLRRRSLLRGHLFTIVSLAFGPNGQILASGDWKGNVIVWDIKTKKQIATLKGSRPWSMTFSPDGQYLLWETRRSGKIRYGELIAVRWRDGTEEDRLTFKSPGPPSKCVPKQRW